MKLNGKTIYAQSSDIKARTYLEYRKDMKKKAIAELEVLEWLKEKIKQMYPGKRTDVYKSGGDRFLWFLRKGGITREPDFIAEINGNKIEIEFQYADKTNLEYYDFKVSKVAKMKSGKRVPISNKVFIYIHKPLLKFAIFQPEWIIENSKYGMVEAWRSYAYRVPKEKFEKLLKDDDSLKNICELIDAKIFLLNFQHKWIEINRESLSRELQKIVDEDKITKIIPKDFDSFFKVCFILDHMGKIPKNANLWLIYLFTYIDSAMSLDKTSKVVYCTDFLYSKIDLKENELNLVTENISKLLSLIMKHYKKENGAYHSSPTKSPIEDTRNALFSINLLEDLTQDLLFYYPDKVSGLKPISKIFENVPDVLKTYEFISNV